MKILHETETLSYEIFNLNDLDRVADVVARAFTNSDPMAIAQQLSVNDFADYIKLLGVWADKQQLTIVAKDKLANEIAGVVLAGDFAADSPLTPENSEHISDKFEPIVELLESLETQYKHGKQIRTGEYLHIYMLAVSPKHQRKQIAQNSIQICLDNGVARGFGWAITEAANSISQHIFKKLDFQPRYTISYKDFTHRDIPVFANIEGHEGTILMDKSLT